MKKIIAVLLSLMMLVPAFAALPVSADGEGAEEKLSAKFYNVTEDEGRTGSTFTVRTSTAPESRRHGRRTTSLTATE